MSEPVLTVEQADAILGHAWDGFFETDTHVAARPFGHTDDGPIEGLVLVARGEAARMIHAYVRDHVPPFMQTPGLPEPTTETP